MQIVYSMYREDFATFGYERANFSQPQPDPSTALTDIDPPEPGATGDAPGDPVAIGDLVDAEDAVDTENDEATGDAAETAKREDADAVATGSSTVDPDDAWVARDGEATGGAADAHDPEATDDAVDAGNAEATGGPVDPDDAWVARDPEATGGAADTEERDPEATDGGAASVNTPVATGNSQSYAPAFDYSATAASTADEADGGGEAQRHDEAAEDEDLVAPEDTDVNTDSSAGSERNPEAEDSSVADQLDSEADQQYSATDQQDPAADAAFGNEDGGAADGSSSQDEIAEDAAVATGAQDAPVATDASTDVDAAADSIADGSTGNDGDPLRYGGVAGSNVVADDISAGAADPGGSAFATVDTLWADGSAEAADTLLWQDNFDAARNGNADTAGSAGSGSEAAAHAAPSSRGVQLLHLSADLASKRERRADARWPGPYT